MSDEKRMVGASRGKAEAPAAPAAPAAPPAMSAEMMESTVEAWWRDHFPGSPVASVTTHYNHAFEAKEELKRRLARLL